MLLELWNQPGRWECDVDVDVVCRVDEDDAWFCAYESVLTQDDSLRTYASDDATSERSEAV